VRANPPPLPTAGQGATDNMPPDAVLSQRGQLLPSLLSSPRAPVRAGIGAEAPPADPSPNRAAADAQRFACLLRGSGEEAWSPARAGVDLTFHFVPDPDSPQTQSAAQRSASSLTGEGALAVSLTPNPRSPHQRSAVDCPPLQRRASVSPLQVRLKFRWRLSCSQTMAS